MCVLYYSVFLQDFVSIHSFARVLLFSYWSHFQTKKKHTHTTATKNPNNPARPGWSTPTTGAFGQGKHHDVVIISLLFTTIITYHSQITYVKYIEWEREWTNWGVYLVHAISIVDFAKMYIALSPMENKIVILSHSLLFCVRIKGIYNCVFKKMHSSWSHVLDYSR